MLALLASVAAERHGQAAVLARSAGRSAGPARCRPSDAQPSAAEQPAHRPSISTVCRTCGEAVRGGHRLGPPLHRLALDLDRPGRTTGTRRGGGGRCCRSGRPPRRRRCAACRSRRRRPSPAGCGRPWPGRPAAPSRARRGVQLLGGAELRRSRVSGAARWRRRCRVGRRSVSDQLAPVIGGCRPPACSARARRSGPRGRRAGARRGGSRRGPRARPRGGRSPAPCSWSCRSDRVCAARARPRTSAAPTLAARKAAIASSTIVPPEGVSA